MPDKLPVCARVHTPVCLWVCAKVCMCIWRSGVDPRHYPQYLSTSYFEYWPNLKLTSSAKLAATKPLVSPCLYSQELGLQVSVAASSFLLLVVVVLFFVCWLVLFYV